jgi:hypothetical protein
MEAHRLQRPANCQKEHASGACSLNDPHCDARSSYLAKAFADMAESCAGTILYVFDQPVSVDSSETTTHFGRRTLLTLRPTSSASTLRLL